MTATDQRATPPSLRITRAERWYQRMLGLLVRDPLLDGEALWIAPCRSVHTVGMRYAIDVVFVDRDGDAVRIVEHVNPFHAVRGGPGAHSVLELRAGEVARLGIAVGQRVVASSQ